MLKLINGEDDGRLADGEEDTADAWGMLGPFPATIGILLLDRFERDLLLFLVVVAVVVVLILEDLDLLLFLLGRLGLSAAEDDDTAVVEGRLVVTTSLSLFVDFCSCSSEDG